MIPMTCVLRKTKPTYTLKNKSKLNHLLYMGDPKLYAKNQIEIESMIHTVRIFSDDIGMEFGLDKSATIKMKRGKLVEMERVTLAEGNEMSALVIKVDTVQCSQEYRSEQKETRLKNWKSKAMNGQHLRQIEENSAKETWQWMKRGSLKRETESLIIAAQDQALRTNYSKAKIEKSTNVWTCRLCKEKEETISHIVSAQNSSNRIQKVT